MNKAPSFILAIIAVFAVLIVIISMTAYGEDLESVRLPSDSVTPQAQEAMGTSAEIESKAGEETQRDPLPAKSGITAETAGSVLAGTVRYRGIVIVVDAQGNEHLSEDGDITLFASGNDHDHDHGNDHAHAMPMEHDPVLKAQVRAGEFTVEAKTEQEFQVMRISLGGRPAHPTGDLVISDTRIEIRAEWFEPTTLRVVDIESGADLSGIIIVTGDRWSSGSATHPGTYSEEQVRVEGEDSPIQLAVDTDSPLFSQTSKDSIWVGATGYTWANLSVDYTAGINRRVELRRSGALEVRLVGTLQKPTNANRRQVPFPQDDDTLPMLRLRELPQERELPDVDTAISEALKRLAQMPDDELPEGHRPTEAELRSLFAHAVQRTRLGELKLETKAKIGDPILLEHLEPGQYEVLVEVGKAWNSPAVLGKATVRVVAGQRERVSIRVEPLPEKATVPLSGTLLFPMAWEERQLSLNFDPIDLVGKTSKHKRNLSLSRMTPAPGQPGLYRWDAGRVVPGRYLLSCGSPDVQWIIETGLQGRADVEMVIGEPAEVSVHLVETATGLRIKGETFHWNSKRPLGSPGGILESAPYDKQAKAYRLHAPAGQIEISLEGFTYSVVGKTSFPVQPGKNELQVPVKRNCGVTLILMHGGKTVQWDSNTIYDIRVESSDGNPSYGMSGESPRSKGFIHNVPGPGTYTVTVPQQPGYESVPPFQVVVREGEMIEHRLKLRAQR